MDYKKATKDCIKCGACTRSCRFLTKYQIDVGDVEPLYDLAYHCFLCGRCNEVCPMDIPCREIILDMRQDRERKGERLRGYTPLLAEKSNYAFKNYRSAKKKSVLFPGCNFPSFYPKTLKYLVELFAQHDIGVAYDCCGKPIAELGLMENEKQILERLRKKMSENGIEELILLCPNCYYYFGDQLGVKITFIYDKLRELGIGKEISSQETIRVFPPCPDRSSGKLLENLSDFVPNGHQVMKEVQCCGLGGVAIVKERELALGMSKRLSEIGNEEKTLYTYCATCCGNIARAGHSDVRHLLIEILGTDERPDTKKSVLNRAKTKIL